MQSSAGEAVVRAQGWQGTTAATATGHLFLYLVENLEDPFEGLKHSLRTRGCSEDRLADIRLAARAYSVIRKVEYSGLKYVRTFYYRDIFRELERNIRTAAQNMPVGEPIFVYLSDEGVWAEFLKQVLSGIERPIYSVNVQHGFFLLERQYLERPWSVGVRRLVNRVATLAFGYPMLGLAFGRGECDVYLCYGERECNFLLAEGNRIVYATPRLIKYNLLTRFRKALATSSMPRDRLTALIAMPACVPGTEFKCDLQQFLEAVAPAVDYLVDELGWDVIVRFHPGRNVDECARILDKTALCDRVEIDRERDVVVSMARCDAVLAAHSTVLFEAGLLGKVPVALRTECFRRPLHYRHEVVDLGRDFRAELATALGDDVRARYKSQGEGLELDWGRELDKILLELEANSQPGVRNAR